MFEAAGVRVRNNYTKTQCTNLTAVIKASISSPAGSARNARKELVAEIGNKIQFYFML
jgi:hypothetical protein